MDVAVIGTGVADFNGTGLGTTAVNKLDVNGGVVIGTTGYAGVATAPASGLLVQGNVGIGLTSPSYPLQVQRAAASGGWVIVGQTAGISNTSGLWQDPNNNMYFDARDHNGNLQVGLRTSGNSFLNGGNVGIGTTTPLSTLSVNGSVAIGSTYAGKPRASPAGGTSRVPWFGGVGFGFEVETRADADLARRMMEFDAQNQTSTTRPCVKDCVHLSLGWKPGENPTVAQMQEAAKEALAAIGMANARALFAIHSDEGYAHIHIVASKIDPEVGRAYDLKSNFLKLSKWAEAYEKNFSGGVVCTQRAENNELRDAIEKRSVRRVLDIITKQRSTFTAENLDRLLKKQITRTAERKAFAALIMADPIVVGLADEAGGEITRYTTEIVLEAEGHVLRAAAGLDNAVRHRIREPVLAKLRQTDAFATMTAEQAAALQHATRAGGLALIDGRSGTGKSFTMAAIRAAYELCGYRVIGLAPTNVVAQDLQRSGFRHATTIHAELFTLNSERAAWNKRTLVMVDEAAMVDTRLMAMLTAHAYASGAKLILVGDDRQLASIDRGGMFGVLKERYGAARLTAVRRQNKKDERRATELMAEGNFYDALAHYDAKGNIHWSGDETSARMELVRRWSADSAARPDKARFVFA